MGPHSPVACRTQTETATTTTTFRMVLMLAAMGMKRFIRYSAMPTTIKAITMFIKGIFVLPPNTRAIHDPLLCAGALRRPERVQPCYRLPRFRLCPTCIGDLRAHDFLASQQTEA